MKRRIEDDLDRRMIAAGLREKLSEPAGPMVSAFESLPKVTPFDYANSFRRNCPSLRLTGDEMTELRRLFQVCAEDARRAAFTAASKEQT